MKNLFPFFFVSTFFISGICFSQPNPLVEKGIVEQNSGNHDDAISDFTASIKKNEAEVQKFIKRIDEFQKLGDFEKAGKASEIPKTDSSFALPYYWRSVSYSATGKKMEALSDLNTAIKINPNLTSAYLARGMIKWAIGKRDEGCIDFGMAASLGDSLSREKFEDNFCWKEAVVTYKEAETKLKMSQFQDAYDEIQKALKLCPDSSRYLAVRGRAYSGLGKTDLAMADIERAIKLNSNNGEAYYARGLIYFSKEKFQEAFDDVSKYIQLSNTNNPEAYFKRASICEALGKNRSAIFDYEQVAKLKPYDPLAYFKSGLLKNEAGDKIGACKDFKKAVSLGYVDAEEYAAKCK